MRQPTFFRTLPLLALTAFGFASASAQVTNWTGEHTGDRFNQAANWDNGPPQAGWIANITDAPRVEIGTAGEMQTGATVNINGASLLERNSTARSSFDGVLNINDTTNVNISNWVVEEGATLNWRSSGTFALAPAGSANNPRFLVDRDAPNALVNIYDGFWDLRGNSHIDSFSADNGTVNLYGGVFLADRRFKLGRGDRSATVNYYAAAQIRAASMGTFFNSVFNFEGGATLYLQAGLLGSFGTEGFDWIRDEMRKGVGSAIHIDGVQQSLGPTDDLNVSNFLQDTVEIDGIWYNAITAIPQAGPFVRPAVEITESEGNWTLRFASVAGRTYQARTATTLGENPATWVPAGDAVAGDGSMLEITLSQGAFPATPSRFFLVEISE